MTHVCKGCGASVRNWQTVLDNLCGLCRTKMLDEMEVLRSQFAALLASGMSREDANAEMIRRMWAN